MQTQKANKSTSKKQTHANENAKAIVCVFNGSLLRFFFVCVICLFCFCLPVFHRFFSLVLLMCLVQFCCVFCVFPFFACCFFLFFCFCCLICSVFAFCLFFYFAFCTCCFYVCFCVFTILQNHQSYAKWLYNTNASLAQVHVRRSVYSLVLIRQQFLPTSFPPPTQKDIEARHDKTHAKVKYQVNSR